MSIFFKLLLQYLATRDTTIVKVPRMPEDKIVYSVFWVFALTEIVEDWHHN